MQTPRTLPRGSLAALSLVHALVLAPAAYLLPWPAFTVFTLLAGGTALGHLTTAALAILGSPWRGLAWRITSFLSLGFLGYLTYASLGSGLYVNMLYEGVGTAILAAAIAAWCVGALFLLPLSLWGISATGGFTVRRPRAMSKLGVTSIVIGIVLLAVAMATDASAARGRLHVHDPGEAIDATIRSALGDLPASPAPPEKASPSLFTRFPVSCPEAVHQHVGVTLFLTFLVRSGGTTVPQLVCLQRGDLAQAALAARETLANEQAFGAAVVDVVLSSRALPDAGPLLGPVVMRPGIEGICDRERCLMPWQLFALDAFTEAGNVSALQAELGVTSAALRKHLGSAAGSFDGLDAFVSRSYLLQEDRAVVPLRHLRAGPRPLDAPTFDGAIRDAASFVVSSQVKDGRFRYTVQPFTAEVSFDNFSVPRQAGTTLALCDAAAFAAKAKDSARASLGFLRGLVQNHGQRGGVVFPKGRRTRAPLGNTALSLIAFLSCRHVVGNEYDETIERLARTLLVMQREDGGFTPAWDPATGEAIAGRDPLYAAGQAVFALVLWEGSVGDGLAREGGLGAAIDKAMAYYAGPYWDIPLRDFFYLEENWHCLAARAALGHHRRDAYERFCIDYMTMKSRFIQSPDSGVDPDHVGSYAFGHVFPPHHAATAGFSEGLAAAIALKRARGESSVAMERTMRWALAYLLRHQWRDDNCFMCTRKLRITGGFSENAASPIVRIDFVQHAMSGILHGGRTLGMVP